MNLIYLFLIYILIGIPFGLSVIIYQKEYELRLYGLYVIIWPVILFAIILP